MKTKEENYCQEANVWMEDWDIGRRHFLPEEVEEQLENSSRIVGISIVWKKGRELLSRGKCVNGSLLYFTMYNAINCNHYINKVIFIYQSYIWRCMCLEWSTALRINLTVTRRNFDIYSFILVTVDVYNIRWIRNSHCLFTAILSR